MNGWHRRVLLLVASVVLMAGGVAGAVASDATTASRIGTVIPFLVGVGCLRVAVRRRA